MTIRVFLVFYNTVSRLVFYNTVSPPHKLDLVCADILPNKRFSCQAMGVFFFLSYSNILFIIHCNQLSLRCIDV